MKNLPQAFITRQKTADKFVLKQMTHPLDKKSMFFFFLFFKVNHNAETKRKQKRNKKKNLYQPSITIYSAFLGYNNVVTQA